MTVVLEKMIFECLTTYGHAGHLGHMTCTSNTNFGSPFPWRFPMKLGFDWPNHFGDIYWFILAFLAHLSQRLIGELIVYQWSGVRRPSVVRPSVRRPQCSKVFFSETAGPIKAKFYVEPPWVGGTIFCSRHLGHMTKMAATPIYGKNPSKIFFSRTGGPIFTKLDM